MAGKSAVVTGAGELAHVVIGKLASDGWTVTAVEGTELPADMTVDALVCCHSAMEGPSWLDCTAEAWRDLRRTNLDSVFTCVQRFANAAVAAERDAAAVVVTADLANTANDADVLTAATAWGVRGLVRNAASAYARKGVRINGVCAGDAPAEDVAELVRFLLDEGAHITGQTLPVANGRALL